MALSFTTEYVKKAMDLCGWAKQNRFLTVDELKPRQLANALKHIAPDVRKEDVVALRDDTFTNNGKEGWLLTAHRIYFNKTYYRSSGRDQNYVDFSRVKAIFQRGGSNYITFTFFDDTTQVLDCSPNGEKIYDFLSRIINLHNVGDTENDLVAQWKMHTHENRLAKMKKFFEKYPDYVPADALTPKATATLKKLLQNPFQEEIVAFHGDPKKPQYGALFTTAYYYYVIEGRIKEKQSLVELMDVYPGHSNSEMTAILKDGTTRPLYVGTMIQHEFELIFEDIRLMLHGNDMRRQHLDETPELQENRTKVTQEMCRIWNRANPRYAQTPRSDLLAMGRKMEASGDTADLALIYYWVGFRSYPPEDSYYYAKSFLLQPLTRFSLSYVYYYLYCLKHNTRWCDDKVRTYKDSDYQDFINTCNETPLQEVRAQLQKELDSYRHLFE